LPANALVQARIDGKVKEKADAMRLMLTRVARKHALPFDPLIPAFWLKLSLLFSQSEPPAKN